MIKKAQSHEGKISISNVLREIDCSSQELMASLRVRLIHMNQLENGYIIEGSMIRLRKDHMHLKHKGIGNSSER